jgi:hypothetical protein
VKTILSFKEKGTLDLDYVNMILVCLKRAYRIMDALIRIVPELEGYVSIGHSTDQDTASFIIMNISFVLN